MPSKINTFSRFMCEFMKIDTIVEYFINTLMYKFLCKSCTQNGYLGQGLQYMYIYNIYS